MSMPWPMIVYAVHQQGVLTEVVGATPKSFVQGVGEGSGGGREALGSFSRRCYPWCCLAFLFCLRATRRCQPGAPIMVCRSDRNAAVKRTMDTYKINCCCLNHSFVTLGVGSRE